MIIAGCLLVALATSALIAKRLWVHDTIRVVDASAALDAYRHSSTSAATTATADTTAKAVTRLQFTPEVGVYRYATSGSEHIDVLGGATHRYPKITTLTVTAAGCGARLRWDILKERREEWQLCPSRSGIEYGANGVQLHTFFGHGDLESFVCDRAVVIAPSDLAPAASVPQTCSLMGAAWQPSWELVGPERMLVGTTEVAVMHVRVTVANNSAYFEHTVIDWWVDDHGLPLRMSCTKSSKSNSGLVGDVLYTEQYTATLQSLKPLR